MTAQPWMKFYPRDWRGDHALRMVSMAARGLWMECICLMHEAKPYGHLVLNGQPVSDDMLSRWAGIPLDQIETLMSELEKAGVLSRTANGVVYSRRMTKDFQRAKIGSKSAKKRWSQATEKQQENLVPNGSPSREPTTQIPEVRKNIKSIPSQTVAAPANGMGKGVGEGRPRPFPSDGSIAFSQWAEIVRSKKRNIDVDLMASAFREFARSNDIPFDRPDICKVFGKFCEKHRVQ